MITLVSSFYNEEEVIPTFHRELKDFLLHYPQLEVILVNNGSTDKTLHLLKKLNEESKTVKILNNSFGRGYGDGIQAGMSISNNINIAIFPSDLQFSFEDLDLIVKRFIFLKKSKQGCINLLTYRSKRFDSLYFRLRGEIWKKLVCFILVMPKRIDPASQLKVVCKHCISLAKASDFFWDLESTYLCVKQKRYEVLKVNFFARHFGKSSIRKTNLNRVWSYLKRVFQIKSELNLFC